MTLWEQTRACRKCQRDKPIDSFGLWTRRNGKTQQRRVDCNECRTRANNPAPAKPMITLTGSAYALTLPMGKL